MKEPSDRSREVEELLKQSSFNELGGRLSKDKAAKIASEFKDKNISSFWRHGASSPMLVLGITEA